MLQGQTKEGIRAGPCGHGSYGSLRRRLKKLFDGVCWKVTEKPQAGAGSQGKSSRLAGWRLLPSARQAGDPTSTSGGRGRGPMMDGRA